MIILLIFEGCNISGFVGSIAALSEILSLTAVSFDRFLVTNNPLRVQKQFSKAQVSYLENANGLCRFKFQMVKEFFMLKV